MPSGPVRRPARVARSLALAHRLEAAIEAGEYRNRAHLAEVLGVTDARVRQILNLTELAPDIQAEVLATEAVDGVEAEGELAVSGAGSSKGQPASDREPCSRTLGQPAAVRWSPAS